MTDHVYCINLEKRPDRKAQAQFQFKNAGIKGVEFFKGTDGKAEAPEGIRITKPEYGCSDSHIRVWRDIVKNGYKISLIFEDDIRILPNFGSKLEEVLEDLKYIPDWDYVNLGPLAWRDRGPRVTENLVSGSAWGAHCYLVSQKCAQKISNWETKDLRYCQDVQIARSPLNMYYTSKPLANQESFGYSTFGVISSWFRGDIGFSRTPDIDFFLRDIFQRDIILIILLLYALKVLMR